MNKPNPDSKSLLQELADMKAHSLEASRLLKTLANAYRLQILCNLGEDELTVGEINQRVLLTQSALSQHLSILREQGVVQTRREGQSIYYRIKPGPALDIVGVLYEHFCASK